MGKNKLLKKPSSMRELALGMITYNASSILGPLIVFLTLGFILDRVFNTRPILIICSVIVSFIVTNILTYKKIKKLMTEFKTIYPNMDQEKKDIKNNQDKI